MNNVMTRAVARFLRQRLLRQGKSRLGRAPDVLIGPPEDPYLRRWWVIPRNRWFNIYLHEMLHDDDDRAMHDHPWVNMSIVLSGSYLEQMPGGARERVRGSFVFRKPSSAHRLEVLSPNTWTLFLTGPKVRVWGFYCSWGWRPFHLFVDKDNPGATGRGCD